MFDFQCICCSDSASASEGEDHCEHAEIAWIMEKVGFDGIHATCCNKFVPSIKGHMKKNFFTCPLPVPCPPVHLARFGPSGVGGCRGRIKEFSPGGCVGSCAHSTRHLRSHTAPGLFQRTFLEVQEARGCRSELEALQLTRWTVFSNHSRSFQRIVFVSSSGAQSQTEKVGFRK